MTRSLFPAILLAIAILAPNVAWSKPVVAAIGTMTLATLEVDVTGCANISQSTNGSGRQRCMLVN